jgi:hypothetical protein
MYKLENRDLGYEQKRDINETIIGIDTQLINIAKGAATFDVDQATNLILKEYLMQYFAEITRPKIMDKRMGENINEKDISDSYDLPYATEVLNREHTNWLIDEAVGDDNPNVPRPISGEWVGVDVPEDKKRGFFPHKENQWTMPYNEEEKTWEYICKHILNQHNMTWKEFDKLQNQSAQQFESRDTLLLQAGMTIDELNAIYNPEMAEAYGRKYLGWGKGR